MSIHADDSAFDRGARAMRAGWHDSTITRHDADGEEIRPIGPLGEPAAPLSGGAIAALKEWTVLTYGAAELDIVAAQAGHFQRSAEDTVLAEEDRELVTCAVRRAVLSLTELQRHVITRRYGLWHTDRQTLREIAVELGVSHVAIAQHECRAMERLRKNETLFAIAIERGLTKADSVHVNNRGISSLEDYA
jgi:hypothetical protein